MKVQVPTQRLKSNSPATTRIENEIDCDEPISGLTYSCTSCKFNLHKWCFELPKRLHHPTPAPLTLLPELVPSDFSFNFHDKTDFAFRFSCAECHQFNLHVQWALLQHAMHSSFMVYSYRLVPKVSTIIAKIPLTKSKQHKEIGSCFGAQIQDTISCHISVEPCRRPTLQKWDGKFYIHVLCALLPPTAKHPCHMHRSRFRRVLLWHLRARNKP